MLIKERSIITWLLHPDLKQAPENLVIAPVSNPINQSILLHSFIELDKIRKQTPEWGLPELLMPSFGEVMYKSHRSFDNIMPQLFEDFCKREECGILLCRGNVTIVYSFGGNQLHIWHFTELYGKSVFNFYTCNVCDGENIGVGITNTLLSDNLLFSGSLQERQRKLAFIAGFVATYVAVKRYIKVETIVIPRGKFTAIEGTPLEYIEKKKVLNQTGQEVIVMDSKWFRKIINENDIYVRGFFRMQNKKNELGEWYKELIFVDSFVRHGYHRNAKIEDDEVN
ncbi:hypothetical protein [Duncaniella muricolitica]|jgi:hypothetical protein|uniref:hypothetical protein n=1 Tax=Duncaniella muricolitica TaxID=2880704 RepID=UPI00244DF973|nr:hypothetical protein [Duncaniella muricolitica]